MRTYRITWWLAVVALVFVLPGARPTAAKDGNSASPAQESHHVQKVPSGQEMKITGIVVKRDADSFIMRDQADVETEVALTPSTDVKTHRKGAFRGGKEYGVSYILRGLRLEAKGNGNDRGQLVAKSIRFDEDDLRTAQALKARVDPVETMAQENQRRIAAAEEEAARLRKESEANAAAAKNAQATADAAMKSATMANNRINGLDDYDPVKTITVLFATGSSVLGPKGKATIDSAAAWVKTQNTKGWVVAVVGHADTTGNTARNRTLSEKRANAVIAYLVQKHNLPLQRLVQPFGYGQDNPVASNASEEGRTQNRRAEIRLLANKGIANTVD